MHGPAAAIRESDARGDLGRIDRRVACSAGSLVTILPTHAVSIAARAARRTRPEQRTLMALLPETIYAIVRSIPRGKVVTYGDIAGLAGAPTGHRQVARAMRHCPGRLPWQRVVGKKDARRGQINIDDPDHAALQRGLLEAEGVVFDDRGCIPLQRFGWLWDAEPLATKKARRVASKKKPAQSRRSRRRTSA
ncbi:MAG TPA: MGMT family protein [Polyangiaceae bacterium]|nr:MGMT family protein [Polyangiaceae bacterium]